MNEPTLNFQAPLINLCIGLQRSIDSVGHAMRAIEEYRPARDHALPPGVIVAVGVSTESHVPGAPIAVQIGPSIPMEHRNTFATSWLLQKGFADVITVLSSFALQQQRLFAAVEVLKRECSTLDDVLAATSLESEEAIRFDRRTVPYKLGELRDSAALGDNTDYTDLEQRVLSINRARNCLEHRHGFVGPQDCGDGVDELLLDWVGPDITDGPNGQTVIPGELVESLHVNFRTKRRKVFERDMLITLSPREYVEICWTVKAYAEEIQAGTTTKMQNDPSLARFLSAAA